MCWQVEALQTKLKDNGNKLEELLLNLQETKENCRVLQEEIGKIIFLSLPLFSTEITVYLSVHIFFTFISQVKNVTFSKVQTLNVILFLRNCEMLNSAVKRQRLVDLFVFSS